MEHEKIFFNPEHKHSYHIQYADTLDFSPGVINMFAYCRVSTSLQAQFGSSVDTQIEVLVNECQRYQYDENNKRVKFNLMRIYVDDGISGKNIQDRPALVELQSYIKSLVNGRTHRKLGLIVTELSRLTRSSEDLESIIKWIKEDAIKLKFVDSSIDPEANSGKMMLSMLASFYEFERKNSAFKTKLTLRSMSENGMLTGHCSYGWTTGTDEKGRKINVPVPEEQEGLQEVIRISRENPEMTAVQIRNLMNESGIQCLRGPGKNFRGAKVTEKSLKRNEGSTWTGKWTTQIIEKIIEHDRFEDRLKLVKEKNAHMNIMKKDEIVIQAIKDHLEATNGYEKETFNFSEIARVIDAQNLFPKKMNRDYIKRMMEVAKIIKPAAVTKGKPEPLDDILDRIRNLVKEHSIFTYVKLAEVLVENNIPLIGKRRGWNPVNVRDLCRKYDILVEI